MKAESGGEVEVESRAINRATLAVFMARPTHSIYASLLSLSNKIFHKVLQIGRHTYANSTWYGPHQFEGKHKFETHYL